jgi:hypothetical protein
MRLTSTEIDMILGWVEELGRKFDREESDLIIDLIKESKEFKKKAEIIEDMRDDVKNLLKSLE